MGSAAFCGRITEGVSQGMSLMFSFVVVAAVLQSRKAKAALVLFLTAVPKPCAGMSHSFENAASTWPFWCPTG